MTLGRCTPTPYITWPLGSMQPGLAWRRIVLWTLAAIVVAVAGLTAIIVAVVMVLAGLAQGVGLLLGGEDWAGLLVVGVGVLGLIAAAGYFSVWALSHRWAQATREKYERRREKERAELGSDTFSRQPAATSQAGDKPHQPGKTPTLSCRRTGSSRPRPSRQKPPSRRRCTTSAPTCGPPTCDTGRDCIPGSP